ncbi:MAG TPA: hypothetical protein VGM88_12610 [Kofleriaceae bacterium]|jgi:hypothetical protein
MRRIALLLVLVSCSGGSVAIDDFAAAYDRAECTYEVRCGLWGTVDDCAAARNYVVDAGVRAAITAGAVDYDGEQAQRCVDELADQSCDTTRDDSVHARATCAAIFVGTLDAGASCLLDQQCESQFCDRADCEEACCTGTCVAIPTATPAEDGDSCEGGRSCAAGLYCSRASQTCVALGGDGAPCDLGGIEQILEECAPGTECLIAQYGDETGTCGALPDPNAPCTPNGLCGQVGDHCVNQYCVAYLVEGETCAMDNDCAPSLRCIDGACAAGVADGGTCEGAHNFCADPHEFCDGSQTCVPQLAVGGACTANMQCATDDCSPARVCADEATCF